VNKPAGSFQGRPIVAQHAGVTVTRVGAHPGAEITGVDLRKPMSDEVRDAIEGALAEIRVRSDRGGAIHSIRSGSSQPYSIISSMRSRSDDCMFKPSASGA
jgi:hypothetical protein